MIPNRRTEEKKREIGVEIRSVFLSLSLQFFGSEPYAALDPCCIIEKLLYMSTVNPAILACKKKNI